MSAEPDDQVDVDGGLRIDIDPELIAAAMMAVESRASKKRRPTFAPSRLREETGDPVTVDLGGEAGEAGEVSDGNPGGPGSPEAPVRRVDALPDIGGQREPTPAGSRPSTADAQLAALRLRDAQDRGLRLELQVASLSAARDTLDRQVRELREAVQQQLSEAEAARVRHRKERDDAERAAEERVLRALFEVGDNLARGIAHAGQDPGRVVEGLAMISEQFQGLLRRFGVEPIDASVGAIFDPSRHEALLHQPTDKVPPGCVVEEVTAGYSLRGRMLRAARVVVASATTPEE